MTATTFMVLTNVNKFAVVGFGIFVLGEARSWQARPAGLRKPRYSATAADGPRPAWLLWRL